MATETYKLLLFLKRNPGMSVAEFRDYCENVHSKMGEKFSEGIARYMRRYVQPPPDPVTGMFNDLESPLLLHAAATSSASSTALEATQDPS